MSAFQVIFTLFIIMTLRIALPTAIVLGFSRLIRATAAKGL